MEERISQDLHHLGVGGNTFSNLIKNIFQALSILLVYNISTLRTPRFPPNRYNLSKFNGDRWLFNAEREIE